MKMKKKLVLTLSEETTQKYLELARKQTVALVDEDCEPSDVLLKIHIAASNMYNNIVLLDDIEIGEASLDWIDN
jgi:hypothetical protein